ncbi:hypothetical protein SOVF_015800 isoform B [Spinacia oleracea]|nr:hypothetical protein SOVF_015800 isoform B [Spinacia oleracea]
MTSEAFQNLVNKYDTTASQNSKEVLRDTAKTVTSKILQEDTKENLNVSDQLIKREEREMGDAGIQPHLQYLKYGNAFLYFPLSNFMQWLQHLSSPSCWNRFSGLQRLSMIQHLWEEYSVGLPLVYLKNCCIIYYSDHTLAIKRIGYTLGIMAGSNCSASLKDTQHSVPGGTLASQLTTHNSQPLVCI